MRPHQATEQAHSNAEVHQLPRIPFGGTLSTPNGGTLANPLSHAETLIDYRRPLNFDRTQTPAGWASVTST